LRDRDVFHQQSDLFRAATDTLLTWLYRRQNWHGLSEDGRTHEPAPREWAEPKYQQLGLGGLHYGPPQQVAGEPGFTPPVPDSHGGGSEKVDDARYDPAMYGGGTPIAKQGAISVPPKAAGLPPGVWEQHNKAEFCRSINDMRRTASHWLAELYALPVTADDTGRNEWDRRASALATNYEQFWRLYWDQQPSLSNKERPALAPNWRKKHINAIGRVEEWLNEMAEEFGCPPSAE
jgi:hypothetical protein